MRYFTLLPRLLALLLTLAGLAGAVGTPAGTSIENQALLQVVPEDPADPPIIVLSPKVTTTVSAVCSVSVLPDGSIQAPGQSYSLLPGETATLKYTLLNTGNTGTTFALNVASEAGSTFSAGDLSIHLDSNGNNLIDSSESATGSVAVPADRQVTLLVRVSTEVGSRGNAFLNLVAACGAALGGAADSNNVAQVKVSDPPQLMLTKAFDAPRVQPGGTVGVTLTVSNTGQGASREAIITDLLNTPDLNDFSYVAGSASLPGTAGIPAGHLEFTADGTTWQASEIAPVKGLRWRFETLAPGTTLPLKFSLTAPTTNPGTRKNVAILSSSGTPDVPAPTTVDVKFLPGIALGPISNPQALPGGELSSDDLQTKDVAFLSQQLCFRQTEQNLGDRDDQLSVRAEVQVGYAALKLLELDGTPFVQGRSLAPNATHDFLLCIVPQPITTQAVTAPPVLKVLLTASSALGAANNSTVDAITTVISGLPTLAKTVSPAGTVKQGDTLTYTLSVSNSLSVDLPGVVLSDPLDSHLDFVSASDGGTLAAQVVTWNLGTVKAGQTVTRTLVAKVRADTADDTVIKNVYAFRSDDFSTPLPSPEVSSPVYGGSLIFSKTSTPAEVSPGDLVTYTFLVKNPSAVATMRMVEITDNMPTGLQYIAGSSQFNGAAIPDPVSTAPTSSSPAGTVAVLVWTLPELGPGAQHEVTFQARVLPNVPGTTVQNTAIARAISDTNADVPPTQSTATNKIKALVFAPLADIVGYVFQDLNRDGVYQQGLDLPVPNARVILSNGRIALTDVNGRYHFGTVAEGFVGLRVDPASIPGTALSVPQDGGYDGSRGVYVRNLTSIDIPLQPDEADIDVIRDTTLTMGTVDAPDLLKIRKQVFTTTEDHVYRVQLTLSAAEALDAFTLNDSLPAGATLADGSNTFSIETLPGGERLLTYRFRFAGDPKAAVTDPSAEWRY
ncbi:DUF11 domain-containing protein [Deinococcus sp. KNUC1210]|uniref:DUF11 domain-containing protein n=1 Tax=Deinococcus sp. KNUC1210 TaxID=2917691 RepID=UPI001EF1296F|nr:DUF11 domain-containing protein [Deinococcus sp. KNUC1210]ULH14967.1 DUF11 domain-containing protein [Deinococcus sp. KNUC1210]